ncbi:MAG TPA: hypothetical protein VIR33_07910 [Thermopolyspora sp.]
MALFRHTSFRHTSRRRDRRTSVRRRTADSDLDSLLALVADSLGYGCEFATDGSAMMLIGPRKITVRLTGLRREAGRRPREDWPRLVSEHLTHSVATAADPLDACDYTQVRPLLRTRAYLEDDLTGAGIPDPTRVIGRHLTPDLVEILTVGYGGQVRPVRPEEAFCWPVTPGQALELAVSNALADERLSAERVDLGGVTVTRLTGSTASAVVHLRRLGDYLPVPRDGVLTALPHPGLLVVHPVDGMAVIRAIERLRLFAQRVYSGRRDGLSPHVYWYRDGRITHIRADLVPHGDGRVKLVVAPPPEFSRLLATLAARSR